MTGQGTAVPDGYPDTLPVGHRRCLDRAVERFAANPVVAGVVMAAALDSLAAV